MTIRINIADIILTLLIVTAVIFAIRSIVKQKGKCSCGCAGCTKNCSSRKTEEKKEN